MTANTGETGREDIAPTRRPIPADSFANRLLLSRAHAGNLTIREAAARCGLNYGSWSNWERGAAPRDLLDAVRRISDGLHIDDEWLLFGGPLAGISWKERGPDSARTKPSWPQGAESPSKALGRPRDTRPSGRGGHATPAPNTRRPVRLA